jgi:uroporphyrinogen decarboxylase
LLSGRERVIRAIEFDGPDRIPHMHSYRYATLVTHGSRFRRLLEAYPSDFYQWEPRKDTLEGAGRGSYTDEWGVTWVKVQDGYMGQPKGHPLESWDAFGDYEVPEADPSTSVFLRHHRSGAEGEASEDTYVCMFGGNVFERLQWLRGMRNVLRDLMTGRRELFRLAEAVVDYNISLARYWCEEGADAIVFSDDWGTQGRLMVNPGLWRTVFKPLYGKMFGEVHRRGAKVHFHSDGYILDIIPDLMDLDLDVINPQLNVHRLADLAGLCGGRLCIRGGLDRQRILPRGTPEQVRRHVLDAIEHFAVYDGGWIGCGELGPDVPFANCRSMMRSFFKLGRYPLCTR